MPINKRNAPQRPHQRNAKGAEDFAVPLPLACSKRCLQKTYSRMVASRCFEIWSSLLKNLNPTSVHTNKRKINFN